MGFIGRHVWSVLMTSLALTPSFSHAEGIPELSAKFRALEALFFMQSGAFPARELHTIHPGDMIHIDRGTKVHGYSRRARINECFPALAWNGPYQSSSFSFNETANIGGLLTGAASVGPGGLIELGGEFAANLDSMASFKVPGLSQIDPDGGESALRSPEPIDTCSGYVEVLDGLNQGRVIVYRVFTGREIFSSAMTFQAAVDAEAKKSEILMLLEKLTGGYKLPIDALEVAADGLSADLAIIRKPPEGDLSLAFVPLDMNKSQVAHVHFFMNGERGIALRDLVQEALQTAEPGFMGDVEDRLTLLFQGELNEEQWARQFLEPGPNDSPDGMQPTAAVIEELEREVPGVLTNLAYYAAAVELAGGSSGIASFAEAEDAPE